MTYRSEFPDFPAGDMPAIPDGFEDVSWHNDAMPRFEGHGVRIWVDYADKTLREYEDGARFSVCKIEDENDSRAYLSTDEWAAVLAFIAERGI